MKERKERMQEVTRRGKSVWIKCRDEREARALATALDGRTLGELDLAGRAIVLEQEYPEEEQGSLFGGALAFPEGNGAAGAEQ